MPRPHLGLRIPQQDGSVPATVFPDSTIRLDKHLLVTGRFFFSLPTRLLQILEETIGREFFDAEMWQLEVALAVDSEQHNERAGFRDRVWFAYSLLYDPGGLWFPEEIPPGLGLSVEEARAMSKAADARSASFRQQARGYCGWLLANPVFLREHDSILQRWKEIIAACGLPTAGEARGKALHQQMGPERATFLAEFSAFFDRWRLVDLPAPYLPSPLFPQIPAPIPIRDSSACGATFFLPDTFAIPTRDEMRALLEDAIRGGETPEHLSKWHGIVRADNRAKTQIDRYARLFLLQHYWMVLFHRHPGAFRGRVGKLLEAIARWLLPDRPAADETIRKDMAFIRKRLGNDWFVPLERE